MYCVFYLEYPVFQGPAGRKKTYGEGTPNEIIIGNFKTLEQAESAKTKFETENKKFLGRLKINHEQNKLEDI